VGELLLDRGIGVLDEKQSEAFRGHGVGWLSGQG
jgi:hypothetical protein